MHSLFTFLGPYLTSPITWFLVLFGACWGSFLNVCMIRIPEKTFWANLRSACPSCGSPIPAWHNIPVLSWFILRGKAACCGAKISKQYPIIEGVTALLIPAIFWAFPFVQLDGARLTFDALESLRFTHAFLFCSALLVCSVIDFHLQIIPDVISLTMVALSPLVVLFHPDLGWESSLYGVLIGGGSLYCLGIAYYVVRKEVGMGMGDVKLLAAIGGWLGHEALIPTLLLSSISGSLIGIGVILMSGAKTMKVKIPFGPFLAIGAVLYLFWGQEINEFLYHMN